jgi:hypothetical protein
MHRIIKAVLGAAFSFLLYLPWHILITVTFKD